MKLISLSVERFRCIRKAKVEFSAGLNVLHGPNDLGKSSLVHAIRAALLLQTNAKESEAFVSWYDSGAPQVELVFESEPQRIWRVKKTFGGASALLEFSRDGVDFSHETRGREVDERLSEFLRWGVAPPGGKGRPKGMPETFLTAALLPDQDRVGAIFEQALGKDSDESGKKWLISALQAMAEDPVFKHVLARVQDRVDEAFSISGDKITRRRGKQSPWTRLNEELNKKQERTLECRRELQKTAAIEDEIRQLRERRLELKEAAAKAETQRTAVLEDLERVRRREESEARIQKTKECVSAIEAELRQLREAESAQESERQRIASLTKECEEAQTKREEASALADKTKEELARLQSADRVRERQLEQNTLQARRAQCEAEQSKLEVALAEIRAIGAAEEKAQGAGRELQSIEKSAAKLRERSEEAAASRAALQKEEQDLRAVRTLFQWQSARDAFEEAENGVAQLNEWGKQAGEKRAAAASKEAAQLGVALPSREQVEALRRLENDIRVAAAGVNVGLSVTVKPKHVLRVEIQRDGEKPTSHDLGAAALDASARRQLRLNIDGVAEISVSGGAEDARERMAVLEKRWAAEGAPLLREAGAADVEDLARKVHEAEQRESEIESATRDAAQLEQRIADQPEWGKLLPARQAALRTAEKALEGAEASAIEKLARKLRIREAAEAEKRIEALRPKFDKLDSDTRECERLLAAENARVTEKQISLAEAQADRDLKRSSIQGDWRLALQQAEKRQGEIQNDLKAVEAGLTRLAHAGDDDLATASAALEKAAQALAESESASQAAQGELSQLKLAHATNAGALQARREAAAKLDESGAREALAQIERELQSAPTPSGPATAESLEEAERALRQANDRLDEMDGQIREKQGALQQVGGEVARQRAEDADIELQLANDRLRETELEYDAWELLRKTLREAEQEEGTNLGRALGDPITTRFEALTGGRYGKFALGAQLETEGISVEGETRDVGRLSLGTRDQLSTIFRLTLAEQLRTAVILDDQLAQSDTKRMTWLRGLLRDVARNIQVIVLTCRPGDYLELPAGKGRARQQPQLHLIDLPQVIERWGIANGQ